MLYRFVGVDFFEQCILTTYGLFDGQFRIATTDDMPLHNKTSLGVLIDSNFSIFILCRHSPSFIPFIMLDVPPRRFWARVIRPIITVAWRAHSIINSATHEWPVASPNDGDFRGYFDLLKYDCGINMASCYIFQYINSDT